MITKLAFKNLINKPLATALSGVLLAVGVGTISLLLLLQKQLEAQMADNSKSVDMVIGAKGSPLQLVLSAVYHIDNPTGNISYAEAKKWMHHPFVETAVPLSYGDSYRGYSIVGTTAAFVRSFTRGLAEGHSFGQDFDVVVGSGIARKLKLNIGYEFYGTHGDANGETHKEHAYHVVGILHPQNATTDHLILCSMESVWKMHEHHEEHEDNDEHDRENHDPEKQITAVLIRFRNPMGLVQLPRVINQNTNMMAATPAIEINRVFTLFGAGIALLKGIGWGIVGLSALSVFIALYSSLENRRYELALMRSLGAPRSKLLILLLLESLILCVMAYITGMLLSRVALLFVSGAVEKDYHVNMSNLSFQWPEEILLFSATLFISLLAALVPATKAASINISKTLSND